MEFYHRSSGDFGGLISISAREPNETTGAREVRDMKVMKEDMVGMTTARRWWRRETGKWTSEDKPR